MSIKNLTYQKVWPSFFEKSPFSIKKHEFPLRQVSKKKAATAMLKLLRGLPAPPHMHIDEPLPMRRFGSGGSKMASTKKKRQNLIKVQKGNADYGQGINPISRLIQIQQAKREKEPTFSLLTERGLPRRREFVMQVCSSAV